MELNKKIIIYVVNVDWFFISHRLPLSLEAIKRGFKVYLIAKNTGKFGELEALGINCINLNIDRSGKNPIKDLVLILNLCKMYKMIRPDIIHHVTIKPSIYGTIASKYCKSDVKVINAVSGLGYVFTGDGRFFAKKITIMLLRYAFSDRRTSFIFQNPDDFSLFRKFNFLNSKNFSIIKGSGVDETLFLQKELYSNHVLQIVLVARMLKDKGVMEFVRAALFLKKKYEKVIEFKLVGGLDLYNPAYISFEELNNMCDGKYLKWLGHQIDINAIYSSADVVCLPSYREGLPKSLVEAMAKGCPIITTDTTGCRECVDHGVNGYLVPVGDHQLLANYIEKLINDKDLRIRMGSNSRKKMLKEFSLKTVINQTFSFYDK
jgi:glycosyltransferase involved in cell wall biosynthesis